MKSRWLPHCSNVSTRTLCRNASTRHDGSVALHMKQTTTKPSKQELIMKYRVLCLSVLMILASTSAFASDEGEFTRGMFECGTLELAAETELACYEDNWHVAVNDCADTGEPSQCWMNNGESFTVDPYTNQPILPGLFEMPYTPEEEDDGIQAMTYNDYIVQVSACLLLGGPIFSIYCIREVSRQAEIECQRYDHPVHCWW